MPGRARQTSTLFVPTPTLTADKKVLPALTEHTHTVPLHREDAAGTYPITSFQTQQFPRPAARAPGPAGPVPYTYVRTYTRSARMRIVRAR